MLVAILEMFYIAQYFLNKTLIKYTKKITQL